MGIKVMRIERAAKACKGGMAACRNGAGEGNSAEFAAPRPGIRDVFQIGVYRLDALGANTDDAPKERYTCQHVSNFCEWERFLIPGTQNKINFIRTCTVWNMNKNSSENEEKRVPT